MQGGEFILFFPSDLEVITSINKIRGCPLPASFPPCRTAFAVRHGAVYQEDVLFFVKKVHFFLLLSDRFQLFLPSILLKGV